MRRDCSNFYACKTRPLFSQFLDIFKILIFWTFVALFLNFYCIFTFEIQQFKSSVCPDEGLTNCFHVKEEKIIFTAVGSRCRQNLK